MDRWTRLGIEAYRTGNREQAQRFFHYSLMENPNGIRTWLWLVEVSDSGLEKQRCLTRVLALDPNHVLARRALEEVDAQLAEKDTPHADPFQAGFGAPVEIPRPKSAAEIRSTPPFIDELAQKNRKVISTPAGEMRSATRRRQKWATIALGMTGLGVRALFTGSVPVTIQK